MKAKFITILFILSFFISSGQSKFSFGASGGTIFVGDDSGLNYKFDAFYLMNENMEYQASFINSDIEASNIDFNMYIINLGVGLNMFRSDSHLELQPILGFSFVSFDDELNLDDNSGLGGYFGANVIYDKNDKFNYGFNTQVTYASHAPGGIIQANLFLRYKF